MRKSLSIEIDSEAYRVLEKRAKQNFMTPRELIEDIIRRSMLSYKGNKQTDEKLDDSLVAIFSRKKQKKK